jgi:hypothetical protein
MAPKERRHQSKRRQLLNRADVGEESFNDQCKKMLTLRCSPVIISKFSTVPATTMHLLAQ